MGRSASAMPSFTLLLAITLTLLAYSARVVEGACSDATVCSACVQSQQCGWCLGAGIAQCVEGNANGTTVLGITCVTWQFSASQVVSQTAGFPVNPSVANVYLYPGEPVTLTVQVTPVQSKSQKLDLVVVQDASSSMNDDLVTFRALVPDLVDNILAYRDDSYFGLTTFIEKPLDPAGVTTSNPDGSPSNYVYKLNQPLTNNYNHLLQSVTAVTTTGNRDWCECSLDGLAYTVIDPAVGWRDDSQKVMVLATDACFHQAGDFTRKRPYNSTVGTSLTCNPPYDECCYDNPPATYPGGDCPFSLRPNDLNMIFDAYTNNTKSVLHLPGTGEDYVSQEQLKNLLQTHNIVPIFAITDTAASPQQEYQLFTALKDYLGFGAIYPLASDSANLVTAIVNSLDVLSRTVTMTVAKDDFNYTLSFTPTTYTNVDQTKVQNFQVTFLSNGPVQATQIQLTVLGFGTTFVNILPTLPCAGCDGVADSNVYIDPCGVCGGTTACADCSGTPYGSKVVDVCGVCGGDGSSCQGCNKVAWSNITYDACGICGGTNECVGCDGVPRSTPWEVDFCGVCGGNNTCLDCNNVPWGNATVDACGVCGGKNACIGCDGNYAVPPLAVDQCGKCGGHDDCYDCFGVINGTAVKDLCGVCNGNNSCRSCDGTYDPKKKLVNDSCGVCGGDGKSCAGCDGVPNSGQKFDLCGVCNGTNACVGCDGVAWSGKTVQCGVCGGDSSCIGCDYIEFSGKKWDLCGECGGNNTCVGCDGVAYSTKNYDQCGVCGGDGTTCLGCDGVVNSSKIIDNCNVCGGTNACLGCDEIPNSGVVYDRCGVCGGNSSCVGCDGKAWSGLEYDDCGVCPNAKNYKPNACDGCDGVPNSGMKNDSCGVCGGNNECLGCDGVPNSNMTVDDCGVCPDVTNYVPNACLGCDGKPHSGKIYDRCGVCAGNNTCVGCDGVVNSTKRFDLCGICDGSNTCLGCDGVPNSHKKNDTCGVCGGNGGSCLSGCDLQPYSTATVDICGICKGDNSSCKPGPPWFLQTRTIAITAGTVGGVIIGVAVLVAALFIYKRLTAGAYWYIPKDLLDNTSSAVVENPLFEASGTGFVENALFNDHGSD